MSALQWIVKEAKSLKKSYPKRFTKWTDYVKQASAIYASKHGGKSPVGKKKAVKKVAVKKAAKKKVGVIKKTVLRSPLKKKAVKKELTAYDVLKFREKVGEKKFKALTPAQRVKGASKKPSEQSILNKIHKVKHDVEKLDEAQHKHMSIGSFSMIALKDNLERLKFAEKNLKNTQENIKISKNIHSSSVYINSLKKNEKMYKDLIKEIKIHITQLKKHI